MALRAAFGGAPIESVVPVGGGASGAFPFRVEVGGRPYLLRVEGTASPLRNPHQYAAMCGAAAAGIAPPLRHADEAARVAVTDFIATRPLHAYPGGPPALVQAVGAMLARLQTTGVFPQFMAYPDLVARLFAHVRRTGLFADGVLDAHAERLDSIRACLGTEAVLVSGHRDLIPANLLFDGERLWLIDWESACATDPLVDVAIVLDTLAPSPELETLLLRSWLGQAPGETLLARLGLVRALTRLYYAGVMLSGSALVKRERPETDLSAPNLDAFRQAVRDGTLIPGAAETRHMLGKMFLAAFLTGQPAPGFEAAVACA